MGLIFIRFFSLSIFFLFIYIFSFSVFFFHRTVAHSTFIILFFPPQHSFIHSFIWFSSLGCCFFYSLKNFPVFFFRGWTRSFAYQRFTPHRYGYKVLHNEKKNKINLRIQNRLETFFNDRIFRLGSVLRHNSFAFANVIFTDACCSCWNFVARYALRRNNKFVLYIYWMVNVCTRAHSEYVTNLRLLWYTPSIERPRLMEMSKTRKRFFGINWYYGTITVVKILGMYRRAHRGKETKRINKSEFITAF